MGKEDAYHAGLAIRAELQQRAELKRLRDTQLKEQERKALENAKRNRSAKDN